MASKITSLGAARFKRVGSPNDITPRDALEEALRQVNEKELNPDHIIILYIGKDDDSDESYSGYIQAGVASWYARMGLIERVKHMMHRAADEPS